MSGNNEQHLDIDPCDIEETEAQKIAAMEAQYKKTFDDMNAKIALLELEKQAAVAIGVKALAQVAEAGAPSAVAPGSGKKIVYTSKDHEPRHAEVVLITASALLELKKLSNNSEAIWWCAKHIERLGKSERADWHDSYVSWAKPVKIAALDEYIPLVAGSPTAGSS